MRGVRLELAYEADLRIEVVTKSLTNRILRIAYQCAYVGRRSVAEIHDDVGVNVGNLRVACPMTFESALIDQASGADTLNFSEDGPCAGMYLQPGMS